MNELFNKETTLVSYIKIKNAVDNAWHKSTSKGRGDCGLTFETLLGKEHDSFFLADYNGIEIKTKHSMLEKHLTLFSITPETPIFATKYLTANYGYPDAEYKEYNIFNLSVFVNKYVVLNRRYFTIRIDKKNEIIKLEIYDSNFRLIDNSVSWSFDVIRERLNLKMKYLALITAKRGYFNNAVYYKYIRSSLYELKDFDTLIDLLKHGKMFISFRVGIYKSGPKFGNYYDHGTSFQIKKDDLELLYKKIAD